MRIVAGKHAVVAGYVPRDAEVRTTPNGHDVCNFSVKSSEVTAQDGTKSANWLNCVAWRQACDVARYITKGDTVLCAGELQQRSYTTRDGDERTVTELVCEFVAIMRPPYDVPMFADAAPQKPAAPPQLGDLEEVVDDDDLPF